MQRTLSTALLCLATACSEDPTAGSYQESHIDFFDIPTGYPGQLDVLFVVDNSPAMAAHRDDVLGLAATLDAGLFGERRTFPDLRVAVTTTGTTGAFRQPAGVTEAFLTKGLDAHYDLTSNFTGSLADALGLMLDVGSGSSAAVAPLASMKAALDAHPGFAREYAMLAIVSLVSRDDQSAGDPIDYASWLKNARIDPSAVMVSAAYPTPAARLDTFHDAFPNRNLVVDFDSADWADTLLDLTQLVRYVEGGSACVRMPADLDPATPGLQVDCSVEAHYRDNTSELLPWCTEGGLARCFEIVADPESCMFTGEDYGALVVRGYPGVYGPSVRGQCVVF